jgi:hypothetical protein
MPYGYMENHMPFFCKNKFLAKWQNSIQILANCHMPNGYMEIGKPLPFWQIIAIIGYFCSNKTQLPFLFPILPFPSATAKKRWQSNFSRKWGIKSKFPRVLEGFQG